MDILFSEPLMVKITKSTIVWTAGKIFLNQKTAHFSKKIICLSHMLWGIYANQVFHDKQI